MTFTPGQRLLLEELARGNTGAGLPQATINSAQTRGWITRRVDAVGVPIEAWSLTVDGRDALGERRCQQLELTEQLLRELPAPEHGDDGVDLWHLPGAAGDLRVDARSHAHPATATLAGRTLPPEPDVSRVLCELAGTFLAAAAAAAPPLRQDRPGGP